MASIDDMRLDKSLSHKTFKRFLRLILRQTQRMINLVHQADAQLFGQPGRDSPSSYVA
jgi:hypothetical protein